MFALVLGVGVLVAEDRVGHRDARDAGRSQVLRRLGGVSDCDEPEQVEQVVGARRALELQSRCSESEQPAGDPHRCLAPVWDQGFAVEESVGSDEVVVWVRGAPSEGCDGSLEGVDPARVLVQGEGCPGESESVDERGRVRRGGSGLDCLRGHRALHGSIEQSSARSSPTLSDPTAIGERDLSGPLASNRAFTFPISVRNRCMPCWRE